MNRAIVLVLDGCGAGPTPDCQEFGDFDQPSTIRKTWELVGGIDAPHLLSVGFFKACGIGSMRDLPGFSVSYGRLLPVSRGKDSVTGHWEMMGIETSVPFPTYPDGFPADLIQQFESRIGRKVIGNRAASGTEIIKSLGPEHVVAGSPILYTSADSVFQIACHEEVVPLEELYEMCRIAREICVAPNNVQRVIARPFVGNEADGFKRTENRKDFPVIPASNLVDELGDVDGIGVVPDLFGGRGFRNRKRTQNNPEHFIALQDAMEKDARFIFANFEDFDMLYGHRNDGKGFARCLVEFDAMLGEILSNLGKDDLLIITADHGNDPTSASTDHSREYSPLCVVLPSLEAKVTDLGDQVGLMKVGDLVREHLS